MDSEVGAQASGADPPPRYLQPLRVASWLLLAFLSLLALASLATQADATLTSLMRVIGTFVAAIIVMCFALLQEQLLRGWRTRRTAVLAVVVVVLGLVNVVLSDTWSLLGISVAAATLAVPERWSLPMAGSVWVAGVVVVWFSPASAMARAGISLTTLLIAVVQYTLTRLAESLGEAHRSRERLARQRVDHERQRISRDLHALIGRTLVAVSLRNEAALRLIDHDVERAREQLRQTQEALARGQAQLRSLTSGPVVTDLADELDAASALCGRLGISCHIETVPVLEGTTSALAALVVREAVTNMLRHSSPRQCRIHITDKGAATMIVIVNDGSIGAPPIGRGRSPGTGLAELRSRVAAAGGSLHAGRLPRQSYQVLVRLPHGAAATEVSP